MQERELTGEDVVALFLDGKTFAEATMVVALGITLCGEKRFLGFVETDTENAQVLTPFLRSLLERGLDISQGLLVLIDGGKGLQAATKGDQPTDHLYLGVQREFPVILVPHHLDLTQTTRLLAFLDRT